MLKVRKEVDVFVRRNYLKFQDDYIQMSGDKEDLFLTISGQRETIDDYEIGDQKMIRVHFRIDPFVNKYEKQVYSSRGFLAQIGGIFSFLKAIGGMLVFMFRERLLVDALTGKLYQVYDEKQEQHKYDDEDEGQRLNQSMNKSSNKIHDISTINEEENNFFRDNPVRNLFKSTLYCRNKSNKLAEKLKNNIELNEMDRMKIKNLASNRKRFNYNTCHILEYLLCCVMCRQQRNRKRWRRHLLFIVELRVKCIPNLT